MVTATPGTWKVRSALVTSASRSEGGAEARCAEAETPVAAKSAATRERLRVTDLLLSGEAEALLEMALDAGGNHAAREGFGDRRRDACAVGLDPSVPGLLDDAG